MRPHSHLKQTTFVARCCLAIAAISFVQGNSHANETVTNIAQLRQLDPSAANSFTVHLEGNVWWSKASEGRLVLEDSSGAEELEMELANESVKAGQRVRLTGNGTIVRTGERFKIGARGPVVDNDGVHRMNEKSGAVYLEAGRNPIRLDWFNGVDNSGLELESQGPGLSRARIPDSALFRLDSTTGTSNFVNGLDYRCYEVAGEALPDFDARLAIKSGTTANFNPGLLHRPEHAGLQFTGYIEAPRSGLYIFYIRSDDGSRLFVGKPTLHAQVIGAASHPAPRRIAIGQTLTDDDQSQWAEVEGRVTLVREYRDGLYLEMRAGDGLIRVEIADASGWTPELLLNKRVRAVGFCQSADTIDGQRIPGILLVPGREQIQFVEPPTLAITTPAHDTKTLPLLTTAAQVHQLKREEAQRGYPVKIRGVVTSVLPEHQAFTLQDATRGFYVEDHSPIRSGPPQIGEYLEIEGTTDPSLFAPIVAAQRVTSLGAGQMPNAVHPTWDQLMTGSLDAQYVEIQGIVTAVQTNNLTLLVRGGIIHVELRVIGDTPVNLKSYENALIRVRGCLFAAWDYATHQVNMGEVRIYGADIFVDQPAADDLFSTARKTAAELRLFDPQAGVFQRVKVSGQIVHARDPEYFMVDGGKGVRVITKHSEGLAVGDTVDVVGFPELFGSASPVLREALARKTGQSAQPSPRRLAPDELIDAEHDATRVSVEGLLVDVRILPTEQLLEMQSGVRSFVARLRSDAGTLPPLTTGSRLELTGVYSGLGGNRATGQDIASFELLMSSPADLKVLARPPWWTLGRLLVAVGALVCVLFFTVLWITQLHRKVEERTAQLEIQIRERQRIEQQRALEQERSRVAQDLHDDLGAGLTEISVLGKQARSPAADTATRKQYLEQMDEKALQMVGALDEIVWAMSPSQDSLESLVSYFCLHAGHFLGLADIAWELEDVTGQPALPINSMCRHELFMAFKEALTNVVRHSGATEVRLGIRIQDGLLRLSVTDNGRGTASDVVTAGSSGLSNMAARMRKLGGKFEFSSKPGHGTILHFSVPTNT